MIKLELTVEEVNLILSVLQEQPYMKVAPLIVKIKTEGDRQYAEQKGK